MCARVDEEIVIAERTSPAFRTVVSLALETWQSAPSYVTRVFVIVVNNH